MFNQSFSHKLRCAYMGVALGLAAAMIYMMFMMVHQLAAAEQMMLIPVQPVTSVQGAN
jgi:hypothetical protein